MKPQTDYTPEELRALDEWAAGFVGKPIFYHDDHEKYISPENPEVYWHPSSRYAPLWQLGSVIELAEKCHHASMYQPKVTQLAYQAGISFISYVTKNPASVIEAIKMCVEEK